MSKIRKLPYPNLSFDLALNLSLRSKPQNFDNCEKASFNYIRPHSDYDFEVKAMKLDSEDWQDSI